MTAAAPVLLATLRWDPQIRGALIVVTGVSILVGSVYLLLATNTGARLGFVLAVAGLTGWVAVMGALWMVFGIGLKGREPTWRPLELVTGRTARATVAAMRDFPRGWKELPPGDAQLADAQAAADRALAPGAGEPAAGGHAEAGIGLPKEETFESPFKKTEDYVLLTGWGRGGETYFLTLRHKPHYAVVQVKPSFFDKVPPGARPQPDLTAPTTSVVMVRDLGNLRLPPFLVMLTSLTVFGVCCYSLHQRDKELMRERSGA